MDKPNDGKARRPRLSSEAIAENTKGGLRDRAILELLYSTGLRLGEVARLTVHDIDCRTGFVRVHGGKGAKDRVVPVGRKAADYMAEYLRVVRA
jgi:integrase/recombinase XerD